MPWRMPQIECSLLVQAATEFPARSGTYAVKSKPGGRIGRGPDFAVAGVGEHESRVAGGNDLARQECGILICTRL